MKLKNIAKASLALGILTTGMITTTAQPVKASEYKDLRAVSNDTFNLKHIILVLTLIIKFKRL